MCATEPQNVDARPSEGSSWSGSEMVPGEVRCPNQGGFPMMLSIDRDLNWRRFIGHSPAYQS